MGHSEVSSFILLHETLFFLFGGGGGEGERCAQSIKQMPFNG